MKKALNAPKLVKKIYSLHPNNLKEIDHFLEASSMTSASDVVRQAISFFHEKSFPAYVFRESAAALKKRDILEKEQKTEVMSGEEYANEFLPGHLLAEDSSGTNFVVLRVFGNSFEAFPTDTIKDKIESDPLARTLHLSECEKRGPIIRENLLPADRALLERKYSLVLV